MTQDPDEDRIRRKAHALWEADGNPHGRDQDHWEQAREMVAIEDSLGSTLLPRDSGAEEPVESKQAATNYGDFPNLTDQGSDSLTDISREPAFGAAEPSTKKAVAAKPRKVPEKAATSTLQQDETKPASKPNGVAAAAVSIVAASEKRSGRKTSGKQI